MKPLNFETDSLSDYVRKAGGICIKHEALKGECKDYFSITEGYNLLNNKTGKTLDYLLEGAMESGYLFYEGGVMLKQAELFANMNKMPVKGLSSPKEQAEDLLEGLRQREEGEEEEQDRLILEVMQNEN
ncbi:MAG: hypothetical protein A3K22_02110 [Deltaproteobacteria bacterium RBG_16_42_7]|nr:MAG: hypothetical protein A3K22_02110 [Deltaproteobacteria bacterium RBG_16_42_7]